MSWVAKLYETYENALKLNLPDGDKLVPVSHTLQNAHINIVIDGEGNFRRAKVLLKEKIMLPATEQSAGRTSGDAPHPLADKLQYVAKDYIQFGGAKKSYFDSYEAQLFRWCESSHSHPKIRAVYKYIKKGCVIEDLIRAKIIFIDENNKLLSEWNREVVEGESTPSIFKILPKSKGKIEQGDALVCWTVEVDRDMQSSSNTWEDTGLQESWILFDASSGGVEGLCFVSGERVLLATNHPAKLCNTGDKAKLISSNDKNGYTYRGRFINDAQACGMSFSVTQKAHSALRWLISRQGYRNANQVVVAWAVSGVSIPSPLQSSEWFNGIDELDEIVEVDKEESTAIDYGSNLGQQFAERLKKKIAGYRAQLDDIEKIIVMGLDSATPGRMSITYYRESNAKEFFERLESWHTEFAWVQIYNKKITKTEGKKTKYKHISAIGSPAPKVIAEAAYGKDVTDSLKKKTVERLLPCIIDRTPFPKDLVNACVQRASNPNAYEKEKWRWRRDINIACALYKGYHSSRNPNINERRNYQMSLDRKRNSRDYLYGRLLAVAENIEEYALKNASENRITNAERLMQRFSSRPFTTWKNIDESLRPYRDRLRVSKNAGLLQYWEKEIQQICALFDQESFLDDKCLTGEYLLGYYCQKDYDTKSKADKVAIKSDSVANSEINQEEV